MAPSALALEASPHPRIPASSCRLRFSTRTSPLIKMHPSRNHLRDNDTRGSEGPPTLCLVKGITDQHSYYIQSRAIFSSVGLPPLAFTGEPHRPLVHGERPTYLTLFGTPTHKPVPGPVPHPLILPSKTSAYQSPAIHLYPQPTTGIRAKSSRELHPAQKKGQESSASSSCPSRLRHPNPRPSNPVKSSLLW